MIRSKKHQFAFVCTLLGTAVLPAFVHAAGTGTASNKGKMFNKTVIASNVATKAGASNAPLQITAKRAVPIGVESLAAPQTTVVDIYYAGRYITTARASFTNASITFDEPEKIVDLLPDVEMPADIKQALSGEIETNRKYLCSNRAQTGCGVLTPSVAGLIFDESSFRVDLFINSAYLKLNGPTVARYLPSSTSGLSLLQNFGSALSMQSTGTSNYTLYGKTAFSYRESSLQSTWDMSQDNRSSVDTLFYQRDYRGRELRSGLFRTQSTGLDYSSDHKLAGLRYASSQNTLIDQGLSQSSDIQVFLQRRAQIDILKDGKLVSSGFYEAGNQLIDSRALPSGAYDVTLKIHQDSGPALLETHFFVKELALPPKSEKQFFVEAGQVVLEQDALLPSTTDSWLLRGGIGWRQRDDLGLQLALTASNENTFLETGLVNIGKLHRSNMNILTSTEGDYGISINSRWNIKQLTAIVDFRELKRSNNSQSDDSFIYDQPSSIYGQDLYDELSIEPPNEFHLLPASFSQHRLTVNYALENNRGNIQLSSSFQKRGRFGERVNSTLSFRKTIKQSSNDSLQLNVSLSQTDDTMMGLVGVTWQMNNKRWSHSVLPESRFSNDSANEESNGHRIALHSSWRREGSEKADLKVAARASGGSKGQNSIGFDTEYRSAYGAFRGQAEHNFANAGSDVSGTRVSVNASTSFITNFDELAWGGQQQAGSALIVDIDGDATDTAFDVYVNDQRRGLASSNTNTVIQLAPFQTYSVYLKPRSTELVNYQNKENSVTLYPGNVMPMQWQANKIHIGFGKVLDDNGEPIRNARIEGAIGYAITDDYGFFQAEVNQTQRELAINLDGQQCTIALPTMTKTRNGIAKYGSLKCLQKTP